MTNIQMIWMDFNIIFSHRAKICKLSIYTADKLIVTEPLLILHPFTSQGKERYAHTVTFTPMHGPLQGPPELPLCVWTAGGDKALQRSRAE